MNDLRRLIGAAGQRTSLPLPVCRTEGAEEAEGGERGEERMEGERGEGGSPGPRQKAGTEALREGALRIRMSSPPRGPFH